MKKWIMIAIIFIVVCMLTVIFYINRPDDALNYKTSEVKKGNIETVLLGEGMLTASKEIKEYAKVSAKVSEIYYLEGDKVEAGYPIIKLDSSDLDSMIKEQELAIKQAELEKQNIEKQISNLKIVAENDGYVSDLAISTGSYVTNSMAICNVIKDNKFEVSLQFVYNKDNPIIVGTQANVTILSSLSSLGGKVTKVSDMRKLITGNIQVIDVTIEVETTGYSLEGAEAQAEVSNGVEIVQSVGKGTFRNINSNVIRAKSTGTVKEVYTNEGKRVKAGEVIAVLDNPDLETNLKNINLTLENLNNQLTTMKKNLEDYLISAQINGTIINQNVNVGDMVMVGTLLTSIAEKETMEFKVPIDELDIEKISYDKEVRVTIDALGETKENPLVGKITDIPYEGIMTDGITAYYVTIQLVGNDKMKISMNAKADIVIESAKDVLYIPLEALVKEDDKRYVDVLLADGITIERREVETGASNMTNIEIKSGLEEGEKVIIQSKQGQPLVGQ